MMSAVTDLLPGEYMTSVVVTLSVGVTRLGSKDQKTGLRKEFTVWNKVRAFSAAAAFIAASST